MNTRLHNKSDNEKKGKSNIHFVRELITRPIRQKQKYEISKCDLAQSKFPIIPSRMGIESFNRIRASIFQVRKITNEMLLHVVVETS